MTARRRTPSGRRPASAAEDETGAIVGATSIYFKSVRD